MESQVDYVHNGRTYMGAVGFDGSVFCRQLYSLLKLKVGLSIKEIGDLDLSHTL